MDINNQLKIINNVKPSFSDQLKKHLYFPLKIDHIEILQINLIRKCNLSCKHCHVQANPHRNEIMGIDVLESCLKFLQNNNNISTIDITGGAPEMNSDLDWFVEKLMPFHKRVIVRTNLVILNNELYMKYLDLYTRAKIEITASLPDYNGEKSEKQRGAGFFNSAVKIIKELNHRGYGKPDSGLILNLVHNPAGAFLPAQQSALEHEYKFKLKEKYDIYFNNLFCLANMPLGRYLEYLIESGNYDDYMQELIDSFNPSAAVNVMCKNTLSVAWDGKLYNCDFNQMLDIPIKIYEKTYIHEIDNVNLEGMEISVNNHCYGCTAGSGSSCQGATS